jgi:hypothetical protein
MPLSALGPAQQLGLMRHSLHCCYQATAGPRLSHTVFDLRQATRHTPPFCSYRDAPPQQTQ